MDGESSPSQEPAASVETASHMDGNNNQQTELQELRESEGPGGEPTPGDPVEMPRVEGVEGTGGEPAVEEACTEGDPQTDLRDGGGGHEEAGKDVDKAAEDIDRGHTEARNGERETEGGREENKDSEGAEDAKSEKDEKQEENSIENQEKPEEEKKKEETGKDIGLKAERGGDKKKQAKDREGGGEGKDKGKGKESERQGKTKRKSGANPPSSSTPLALSRPRTTGRSGRPSTKNDIIAKFQQGAPETPIARNFKVQKSSMAVAAGASIKQKMLQWCRNKTRKYEGINIENFSSSWCDGLAFCALIHRFFPDAFDYSSLKPEERGKNFTLAFSTAESLADCCPLLEVADMLMMGDRPDPMCVFTYVQALCHSLSKIEKARKDQENEKEKSTKGESDKLDEKVANEAGKEGPTEEIQGEMVVENGTIDAQMKEKDGGGGGGEGAEEEEEEEADDPGTPGIEEDEENGQKEGDGGVLVGATI